MELNILFLIAIVGLYALALAFLFSPLKNGFRMFSFLAFAALLASVAAVTFAGYQWFAGALQTSNQQVVAGLTGAVGLAGLLFGLFGFKERP